MDEVSIMEVFVFSHYTWCLINFMYFLWYVPEDGRVINWWLLEESNLLWLIDLQESFVGADV